MRMSRQYFGTDGIRGRTNQRFMTAELAMKVGMAAGTHFLRGDHRHRVVIGKDTRLSGYMIENALVAGFTAVGMDVVQFGRSEEHTSELQSLMRISYAVFCLKKKKKNKSTS